MSGKNNGNAKNGNQASREDRERVITKYDLKVERRKIAKEQEKKDKRRTTAIVAVIVVAILAWIASYPVLHYIHRTESWVKVNGDDVTREEFDYYYNTSINNFYSQYSSYASYFGVDFSAPLDQQSYSDTMTWKDYFEQQAVTQIRQVYGLTDEAAEKGFTYDASGDVDEFVKSISDAAESADASLDDYVVTLFGENAKLEDIKGYVEQSNTASAYYETIEDGTEVAEDEIQSYYDEHKADYDSVDYKVCKIEVTGKGTDYISDPGYRLSVTNKSDQTISLAPEGVFTVNGAEIEANLVEFVDPGQTVETFLSFPADQLGGGAETLSGVAGKIVVSYLPSATNAIASVQRLFGSEYSNESGWSGC